MLTPANVVPLSDTGWAAVAVVTALLAVAWVVAVVVVTRVQLSRGDNHHLADAQAPHEGTVAKRVSARTVLVVAVVVAALAVVVFLVGRIGDLVA
ncbi:hypothetical protein [Jannaschia sp. R86511]|uniref:hypothetical protein n=1 Tax=Jannaschia sp. R86511 TaxID=3093853 RepID=UPI0036D299AD